MTLARDLRGAADSFAGAASRGDYISDRRIPRRTAMTQNAIAPVDQLWASVRREAESVLARDPLFGASLSAAILDHSDLGAALAYQIGERLGRHAADRELFARVAREAFQAVARSGRRGEPRSSGDRRSRSRDHRASAAAAELQGIRRAAGLARVELAVARAPDRSGAVAAKLFGRFTSGQYPSVRLDRHVGIFGSCDRHHRRVHSLSSATR